MYVINTLYDIQQLSMNGTVSAELVEHFIRKVNRYQDAWRSKCGLQEFSLETYGSIGLIEQGDQSLASIGLSEDLANIMPEWVSRLELAEATYYVLYITKEDGHVLQIYLPDNVMSEAIHFWLSKQPVEEEAGESLHQRYHSMTWYMGVKR